MSLVLKSCAYVREQIVNEGNRFLLGNGHLGYRGTYEECGKEDLVALNLLGVYDRRGEEWRESVNMPNPFFVRVRFDGEEVTLRTTNPLSHLVELDLAHARYEREDEFPTHYFHSMRFVSCAEEELLGDRIRIKAKTKGTYQLCFGIDLDIYDIHGPHFRSKEIRYGQGFVHFRGLTNEGKTLYESLSYSLNRGDVEKGELGMLHATVSLEEGEEVVLTLLARVSEDRPALLSFPPFGEALRAHESAFEKRFLFSRVLLAGSEEGMQFALDYSIYHLCILGSRRYARGIPARGVSGQVYKGASFWDSEIFLVPFFSLTDPEVAKNLLRYRVKTLHGAQEKAEEFGYQGAFYAWESQDDGREACSKYNVTDPVTNEPIRTYFNEKQIHISADIPYAIETYLSLTGDVGFLEEGAREVLVECAKFFCSYATMGNDGKYHLNDVIGPDEYHERVDDNAFTNYMAANAVKIALSHMPNTHRLVPTFEDFLERIYLPRPNQDGVIEQFRGYFSLEKTSVEEVRSRLRNPQDYWGGKFGVATPTQVIKQADVAAMLALLPDAFSPEIKKANYDYYFPLTEHGSSLSASMYGLLALELGNTEESYASFYRSASVDLRDDNKTFAGGVYIGGTHPASAGGAYLCAVYGFAGLSPARPLQLAPALCTKIPEIQFHFQYMGKPYCACVTEKNTEVVPDEI